MTSRKAKAPTALASGDALGNVVAGQLDNTDIAFTASTLQALYLRRRSRIAPSLVPTLSALVFGGAA